MPDEDETFSGFFVFDDVRCTHSIAQQFLTAEFISRSGTVRLD